MPKITKAQMRAVEVLHSHPMRVGEFIHKLWPEKVLANDKISGGYVLAACCLLRRLESAGLAVQMFDEVNCGCWKLSNFGVSIFYALQRK